MFIKSTVQFLIVMLIISEQNCVFFFKFTTDSALHSIRFLFNHQELTMTSYLFNVQKKWLI
jgi:hypothetical protein